METAGVVLAALPLLINGLTGMARAAETFDKLRKPSKEIGRYARKLKRELTLYESTLTELLEGLVSTDDERQEMMLDAESDLWMKYDTALRQRLGHSYESFLDTIEEIEDELKALVDKLKLKATSATQKKDEEFWSKEVRRFKMAFNKDAYQELCKHIQELNNFLTSTTQSSLRIEVKKRQRGFTGTGHSARLKRLREDARNIHCTVTSKACWKCSCQHKVMLRMRSVLSDLSGSRRLDPFPEHWRLGVDEPMSANSRHLLELHPQEDANKENQPPPPSTTSQPSRSLLPSNGNQHSSCHPRSDASSVAIFKTGAKKSVQWEVSENIPTISVVQVQMAGMSLARIRIDDMCSSLLASSGKELGYLEGPNSWRCNVRYTAREDASTMSLGSLLDQNSQRGSAACVVFSRRERLAAAATLAFSVLFLDGSWLKPVWSSDDIVLVKDVDKITDRYGTQHTVSELAFSWMVCSANVLDTETEQKYRKLKMQRKTAVLFALAMALTELSLGEPMYKLKSDEERLEDFVSGNFAAASRLLPKVQDASGFEYAEVVRKCLDCPFDVRDPSMDNETFLGIYFDEIARPLMSDYEQFMGLK